MSSGSVHKKLLTECVHKEYCKKKPKCRIAGEFRFKETTECPARDFDRDSFGINKAFRLL